MDLRSLLSALAFAADKHQTQRRKNAAASPYINHPIAVASVLASEADVVDDATVLAALLHDTVEDTETTVQELEQLFGAEVSALVAEVTDDKSLPKKERKHLQVTHASHASPKAKRVKIADKICNVRDVAADPPSSWSHQQRREYLDWAEQVVAGCRGVDPALERVFDTALAAGREVLETEKRSQGPHPTAPWKIWYRDTFDREAAPLIDVEGEGLVNGLMELWARHLFESVSSSGTGFSRFYLTLEARTVTVSGDSKGAGKLREWMYGDKRHSKVGYVAESNRDLLERIATHHAGRLEQPNPTERIFVAALEAADRTAFLERLA